MTRQCKVRKRGFLLALMLLGVLFLLGNGQRTEAATKKCKVTFANIYGNSNAAIYKKWSKAYSKVNSGSYITLPSYKPDLGYKWVIKKNGKITKTYAVGARVKITSDVTFRLKPPVRTVRFYSYSGNSEFKNLKKTVYYGSYVVLPTVSSTNYEVLGWKTSLDDDAEVTPEGTKVKVTQNLTYYISVKWLTGDNVNLYTSSGSLWKVVDNSDGTATFPSVSLGKTVNRMVLGWSRSKGKTKNPEYYEDDTIPTTSGNYYMVVCSSSQIKKVTSLTEPKSAYDRVYFVGDSRTVQMEAALSGKSSSRVKFIAKSGKGLEWFKNTGFSKLLKDVKSRKKSAKKAVIINLGVNDTGNADEYVTYMKKVAATLKKYNCKMFYLSVNPVNTSMAGRVGSPKTAAKVKNFNSVIYSGLCTGSDKSFTYINTCKKLMENGWLSRYNSVYGCYDGVHYSNATYSQIYDYCIKYINSK